MSAAAGERTSIVRKSTNGASVRRRGSLPAGRCRAGPDLSSLAKTFHVFRIVGQIFGQPLHRAGKVARQVVTRDCSGQRLLVQALFEAFPHQPGFRHPPRLGLSTELSEELIRQLHRDRSHAHSVMRAVLPSNTLTRSAYPSSSAEACAAAAEARPSRLYPPSRTETTRPPAIPITARVRSAKSISVSVKRPSGSPTRESKPAEISTRSG